ncbi:MAG: ISAs1 family transposase [Bacteroidetes bacterium]|nr:ISAs1 family transposase [Bacteroidota bacterium]
MHTHEEKQETTFYEQIQNCSELDLRDKRGKFHALAFILLGLTIGLLRKRDGCLSSIHRNMMNKNAELCSFLGIENQKVVSRSHLPIVLQKVNLPVFEQLLFDNYAIELNKEEKEWFAGDGKELRGSIEKGNKRGEAVVQLVRHDDRNVLGQAYYNGKKESEKPCLQGLLCETGAINQKVTMDALHLCPSMTEPIVEAGGIYLIGLKANQEELLEDMKKDASFLKPLNQLVTVDKGHGRLEKRSYFHYDIGWEYFEDRWAKSNFQSLFKVERNRIILNTNKQSNETAYYISNGTPDETEDYFNAIRCHWSVEVSNHVRDKTLQEDDLKTKKTIVTKVFSGLRTLVIKLLGLIKPKNMVAQLELFQDNFSALMGAMRAVNLL